MVMQMNLRRRIGQFRLRTLFFLILVCGIGLGSYRYHCYLHSEGCKLWRLREDIRTAAHIEIIFENLVELDCFVVRDRGALRKLSDQKCWPQYTVIEPPKGPQPPPVYSGVRDLFVLYIVKPSGDRRKVFVLEEIVLIVDDQNAKTTCSALFEELTMLHRSMKKNGKVTEVKKEEDISRVFPDNPFVRYNDPQE